MGIADNCAGRWRIWGGLRGSTRENAASKKSRIFWRHRIGSAELCGSIASKFDFMIRSYTRDYLGHLALTPRL